jgi:hypothetical protein
MNYRNSTRPAGRRLARAAARLFAPCLLIVLICGTAAAYTVVMRGGRRVEIPGEFELTRTMLIYEAAPGVSVTLPLDLVDVEATERVNGEPAGGFLRRARDDEGRAATRRTPLAAAAPRPAPRTFTNRDLEAVRRARVESERDYERRRVELGLPSAEEMRLHNEREEASMRELARRKAEEDAAAERDRRARRDELQVEMSLLDDERYHARRSIELSGDTSGYFSPGVVGVVTTGRLFGGGRFYGPRRRALPYRPSYPAGAFGDYGARYRPRLRRGVGAGVGLDVNGGTRAVIGFGRRSLRVRPAGRR